MRCFSFKSQRKNASARIVVPVRFCGQYDSLRAGGNASVIVAVIFAPFSSQIAVDEARHPHYKSIPLMKRSGSSLGFCQLSGVTGCLYGL